MESTQPKKVRRVRVKKPLEPGFRGSINRFIKTGYISDQGLWKIVIFAVPAILIIAVILVLWFKPLATDWKGGVLNKRESVR